MSDKIAEVRHDSLATAVAALFGTGLIVRWVDRRLRAYARALGYATKKSHSYDVSNLEDVKLDDDQASRPRSTVLLEIDYRSTVLGSLIDPRITIHTDDGMHEFWLERGGRGMRYLVLPACSSVRVGKVRACRIVSVRRLDAGSGDVPEGPILIIAPHPDDAEIAAYGLYRERSEDAHIVVVTTGDRGKPYETGVERDGGWTAWLRRFDGLTVPLLGGVSASRIQSLDFPEDALAKGRAFESLDELEARLAEIVERVRPASVVVPHPIIESHPAHLACTLATLRALRKTGSRAEALFCLIHVPGAGRYPLGPRHAAVPLPPWHEGGAQFERLVVQGLSPVVRVEKLFALDAHHDLRPAPLPLHAPESVVRILRQRWRERTTGVEAVASRTYLRRAPRPYEVFLAVSPEGLPTFVERLERRSD